VKAKGLKSDMVRAYSGCPGVTFSAPNASTMAGVPACGPPTVMSTYQFGPKGACKVRIQQRAEFPCLGICGSDCANLLIRATCKDIQDSVGAPIESNPWVLRLLARATLDDDDAGDVTIIDLPPSEFFFSQASNGKIKLKQDLYSGVLDPCSWPVLPPCMMTEWLSVKIADPDGKVFATLGSSTR